MIVELTKRRYDQILYVGEDLIHWIQDEAEWASSHRVDVLMPAVGWEIVRSRLFDLVYTAKGARRREIPRAAFGALQMVTAAVAKREAHPGYTGVGAFGIHDECLSAWRLAGQRWVCYPLGSGAMTVEYTVLMPYREETAVGKVTMWAPAPSLDHPTLKHPYFWRESSEALMDLTGSPSLRALEGSRRVPPH